jgi:hypothetical protein
MVTNYPQQLAAATEDGQTGTADAQSVMARVAARLGQVLCGLSGHDAILHFEGKRVMMRCTSCGYDSPGWEVSGRGPRLRYEGDARRHLLGTEPRLVLRKTA